MTGHQHKPKKPPKKIASPVACAHCGSPYNYGEKVGDWHDVETLFFVVCGKCGATGPKAETQSEALQFWADRSPPLSFEDEEPPHGFEKPQPQKQPEQQQQRPPRDFSILNRTRMD